jgi:hypothetical protein
MESTRRFILRTSALMLTLLPALHAQVGTATQTTLAGSCRELPNELEAVIGSNHACLLGFCERCIAHTNYA